MNPLRVLHINAGSRNFGGVSAICLNLYRNINRELVQFDFLTPNETTYREYAAEIREMGGHIYEFGIDASKQRGKLQLIRKLKRFFAKKKYDVVHVNSGVLSFNALVAYAARKYSGARVFVHSHSNAGRNRLKEIFSSPIKAYAVKQTDELLACSKSAAAYMFPRKYAEKAVILDNGIDVDSFRFDPDVREKVRTELNLQGKFVIGHVGRFMKSKNHSYLIRLFAEIKKVKENAVLLLIGDGELMDSVKQQVQELKLQKSVHFLGQRKDMPALYQAMDVFLLPSKAEGFGIVNIEAQTAGLKCVVSDVVPEAANAAGLMVRKSLDAPISEWVDEILNVPKERKSQHEIIEEKGFNIKASAAMLERMYLDGTRRDRNRNKK